MGADLFEIEQSLQLDRKVIGFERTIVEAKRFPKLESQLRYGQDLNMLYRDYGVIQTRASDTVRACLAAPDVAARLAIAADAFVVEITRVSYGIDDRAIELKRSWLAAGVVVHRSEIT
jgi:DNA-binding GntR family transcriptional regulator